MTTKRPFTRLDRMYRNPEYLLAVAGAILGHVTGGTGGAILGAVFGFFVGKTVQSLTWTLEGK